MLIELPFGLNQYAVVNLIIDPLSSSPVSWTVPLPYDLTPTTLAPADSFSARVNISDADALLSLISTTILLNFLWTPSSALNVVISPVYSLIDK